MIFIFEFTFKVFFLSPNVYMKILFPLVWGWGDIIIQFSSVPCFTFWKHFHQLKYFNSHFEVSFPKGLGWNDGFFLFLSTRRTEFQIQEDSSSVSWMRFSFLNERWWWWLQKEERGWCVPWLVLIVLQDPVCLISVFPFIVTSPSRTSPSLFIWCSPRSKVLWSYNF